MGDVDRLVADREPRPAAEDDVELLLPGGLGVVLDHRFTLPRGPVGVDAERADVEPAPNRDPLQRVVTDRDRRRIEDRERRVAALALHRTHRLTSGRYGCRR